MKRMPTVKTARDCDCEAYPFCFHTQGAGPNARPTPAATVAALMAPLATLYRRGSVKPGAVAVTPAQFDALCDLAEAAPELLAALELFADIGDHEGEPTDEHYAIARAAIAKASAV